MDDRITLEKALELVDFELYPEGWRVKHVKGTVCGDLYSNVLGDVWGDVRRNVYGNVGGTINGRKWQFVQTPKEELRA